MALEHEPTEPAPVEAIHYYPKQRSLIIKVEGGLAFALIHQPDGIFYELLRAGSITERSVEQLVAEGEASTSPERQSSGEAKEKEPIVTLTGRLKSKPQEGRPDRSGKPTAWARLAVHEEGKELAHMYSVTFHRHTAKIALSLPQDVQVTVQGYARASEDPARMDRISVFNLPAYPGKPPSQETSSS